MLFRSRRNVNGYPPVPWINAHLKSSDRVLITTRQINYLIEVPTYYANAQVVGEIETRPENTDSRRFWTQLRRAGITHLLVEATQPPPPGAQALTAGLLERGCVSIEKSFEVPQFSSRTLRSGDEPSGEMRLYRMEPGSCPYSGLRP